MAGGHSPTNTNYLLSYDDDVKRIENEHQDWQPSAIRKEAAIRFRPKFRQDKAAFEKEMSNLQEYDGPEFTLKNGEVYYQSYGRTLEELNTRTLEITPDQYSLAQHQTSALINEAFRNGSTEVVTSYYRDGEDHRDLLVMTIDPATGKGKTKIINCARNGNFHEFTNMQSIAKSRFTTHYEIRPANNVFLLSNKPVHYDTAGATVKEVAYKYENYLKTNQKNPKLITQRLIESSRNSVKEVRATAISMDAYVQRTYGKRLQDVPMIIGDALIHRVQRMFERPEKQEKLVRIFQHLTDRARGRKNVKVKTDEIRSFQYQNQEKIATSVVTLLFVRETRVGIGGIFESINTIVRLPKVSLESAKRIKKEKLQRRKRTLEKMRVFRMSEAFKKLTKKERRAFQRKEKKLQLKEKKIVLRKERKLIRRKEKVLWKTLKRLVHTTERKGVLNKIKQKEKLQKIKVAKKEMRQTKKQEKQHVKDFSVALVILFLLRPPEKRLDKRVIKHEKQKKLIEKEPAPWLLFAIIWHLAMIREAGVKNGKKLKKTKKQKTQYVQAPFLQQGVIFAYAS